MNRTAVVTGAGGQDGYFLVARLRADGWAVHALLRDGPSRDRQALDLSRLAGPGSLDIHILDITDGGGLERLVRSVRPDELYNLAGLSSVSASFEDPSTTWRTNADAVQDLLEVVRTVSPETRFYQSSSTEMFGAAPGASVTHDEDSPFMPQSPYAAAKAAAHLVCDAYRRAFDLRVAAGVLSNHESHRRGPGFLTRKLVDHVREIGGRQGDAERPLYVGNLAAQRDWGYAPDYVDGMIRITRQVACRAETLGKAVEPDTGTSYRDYVLGSGRLTAVWQLVDRAFALGGLPLTWDRASDDPADWSATYRGTGRAAVAVDRRLSRPTDPVAIRADPARARRELGWRTRGGLDRFLRDMLGNGSTGAAAQRKRR